MDVISTKAVFSDERGSIYDLIEAPVSHVGLITSRKGSVRGKHFHRKSTQFTYVISGSLIFYEKDMKDSSATVESRVVKGGDLVKTPPNTFHAMRFLEDSTILDATTEGRSGNGYEEDTVRVDEII